MSFTSSLIIVGGAWVAAFVAFFLTLALCGFRDRAAIPAVFAFIAAFLLWFCIALAMLSGTA